VSGEEDDDSGALFTGHKHIGTPDTGNGILGVDLEAVPFGKGRDSLDQVLSCHCLDPSPMETDDAGTLLSLDHIFFDLGTGICGDPDQVPVVEGDLCPAYTLCPVDISYVDRSAQGNG
jgi:hypothetical protein